MPFFLPNALQTDSFELSATLPVAIKTIKTTAPSTSAFPPFLFAPYV